MGFVKEHLCYIVNDAATTRMCQQLIQREKNVTYLLGALEKDFLDGGHRNRVRTDAEARFVRVKGGEHLLEHSGGRERELQKVFSCIRYLVEHR